MAAVNKVLLIGNLGADPEVKTLPSGDKVATIRMATTETYKNKNGEKVEDTEWHRVEFWGGLAGIVEQYVKKGDSIYVEGRIRTEKYTDSQNVERYSTKIRASQMQMLGRSPKTEENIAAVEDDHLPF
ncbi:single-strand binding protein [Leadbetterella byssophila DSM 17132]|uniref:Single-stranded DNA-binding protein n=1 Tax=Leadbetterella byssophila (strain DSM 17132 / JCM 16389 / KACC 11308 / NBRC 106382 / 4M15) TaxID=649349 RepID=E4RV70_LEAB4|nr:single-stranded DNA-binding protein [Leadbetterella byssophila]ADQ18808.1 single-strand binding protein [Leadbetterella byssophila DSM 17132]